MSTQKKNGPSKQTASSKKAAASRLPGLIFLVALLSFVGAGLFAFKRMTTTSPADRAAQFMAELVGDQPNLRQASDVTSFSDVSAETGLDFVHESGAKGNKHIPEIIGPGAAFLDFDGDGLLDVFLTGGGEPGNPEQGQLCRLYRNEGSAFSDVTDAAGVHIRGQAYGVACADFDEDGDVDLYVTRLGPNALLVNDGLGHFSEQAAAAGVDHPGFGTSCVFFDYDRDGLLDLYVTNYVDWFAEAEKPCLNDQGIRDYCMPNFYESPSLDVLYRNLGAGKFEDVSRKAGIATETGNGLGVIASDFDSDGFIDLYVANDQTPAFLWQNQGNGSFENIALLAGCAYNSDGVAIAGMGIACEDFNRNGRFDLLVTNLRNQSHLFLENEGDFFTDKSATKGLGIWSGPATAFGISVFDQNQDGNWDAYIANGDVALNNSARRETPYAQKDHFVRLEEGLFVDYSETSGSNRSLVSRSIATADYDNDGDLDLLITNNNGPVQLLRNNTHNEGNWLTVAAHVGASGRYAIGARMELTAAGKTWLKEVRPQQGYLSSNDPRVHFGLGQADVVTTLTITWPDGSRETYAGVTVNQHLNVTQGKEKHTDKRGGL